MSDENRYWDLLGEGLVTVKDAGRFLGLSVGPVYNLMARGDLAYVKLGRSRRIPRRALVELTAKNLVHREDA